MPRILDVAPFTGNKQYEGCSIRIEPGNGNSSGKCTFSLNVRIVTVNECMCDGRSLFSRKCGQRCGMRPTATATATLPE